MQRHSIALLGDGRALSIIGEPISFGGMKRMPSSSVQNYLGPEQMEAAYTVTKAELTPTARGPFAARVVSVQLDHLWLRRVHENAPRIKHAVHTPARAFMRFLTKPGPGLYIDGVAIAATAIARHSRAQSYYERSTGPVDWGAISLPVEHIARAGAAIAGCDLAPPRDPLIVTPSSASMTRLQRLHAAIESLAVDAPEVIENPGAAHGLEQSLIEAMVDCLSDPTVREDRWAQQCHTTIIRRFRRLLEDNSERALYIPEICAAIGVPDRTLRMCCQEHLGMSPKQYLLLRRMNLANRALRGGVPAEITVTEVATRFGFWHFGRFATGYRSIFGELPSVSLNRPPD